MDSQSRGGFLLGLAAFASKYIDRADMKSYIGTTLFSFSKFLSFGILGRHKGRSTIKNILIV